MDRKIVINALKKNKYLILICTVIVLGTFFGVSMLKFLPNEFEKNLFIFLSSEPKDIYNIIINKFAFPFIALFCLYFSGTSLIGNLTAIITMFLYGTVYGFQNGIFYAFGQNDHIFKEMISYFSGTVFFVFLLIIMAENSFFSSIRIKNAIKKTDQEKPHYDAKKQTVKFITFTVVFATISVFSSFFEKFILSLI